MSKNHSALEGHFKSSQQMLTSILFYWYFESWDGLHGKGETARCLIQGGCLFESVAQEVGTYAGKPIYYCMDACARKHGIWYILWPKFDLDL